MELEDAIHTAMLTLKENFEGEMNERNIQVAYVSDDNGHKIHIMTPEEIKDYLEDSARARMEVDVARREIERLNREISSLRERIAENK